MLGELARDVRSPPVAVGAAVGLAVGFAGVIGLGDGGPSVGGAALGAASGGATAALLTDRGLRADVRNAVLADLTSSVLFFVGVLGWYAVEVAGDAEGVGRTVLGVVVVGLFGSFVAIPFALASLCVAAIAGAAASVAVARRRGDPVETPWRRSATGTERESSSLGSAGVRDGLDWLRSHPLLVPVLVPGLIGLVVGVSVSYPLDTTDLSFLYGMVGSVVGGASAAWLTGGGFRLDVRNAALADVVSTMLFAVGIVLAIVALDVETWDDASSLLFALHLGSLVAVPLALLALAVSVLSGAATSIGLGHRRADPATDGSPPE